MMKSIVRICLFAIALCCGACSKENETKVAEIAVLNIPEDGISIALSETFQVDATMSPSDAERTGITYKSGDEHIFVVSATGLIQPKQVGEADLTVKTQDGSYLRQVRKIMVTPRVIPIESMEITGLEEGVFIVGFNQQRTVQIDRLPEDSDFLVHYASSDESVFSVSADGKVKGLKLGGEAQLIVTSIRNPEIKATCMIRVLDLDVDDIIFPTETVVLARLGDTFDLRSKLVILPAAASGADFEFESNNQAYITVDAAGVLTSRGRGEAEITVRSKGDNPVERKVIVRSEAELSYDGWTVTASSYNASQGTPGAILVDGASPFWHSKWEGGSEPLPHWLLVDMKESRMISQMRVERRVTNTDLRKAIIEISADGGAFTTVGTLDWGSAAAADNLRYAIFEKQKVRYIRITVTESNRSPNASINRFRVYGASE